MMRRLALLLFLPSLTVASMTAAAPSLLLARDGKASLPVVLPEAPPPAEQTAAGELALYLGKMSGAEFKVMAEASLKADAPGIYIGQTAFAQRHGVDCSGWGPEESLLRTVGGSLILTGGRPRGTLHAVYELLEHDLGCRWYTPWIEKVPRRTTLSLPRLDRRFQPFMKMRSQYTHLSDTRCYPDHEAWVWFNVRNRMNDYYGDQYGGGVRSGGRGANHSFAQYVPADKYFADHPEYFSERHGKRVPSNGVDGNHLCLTNPDVLRIVTEGVKEDIAKKPWGYYYSVSINDGGCSTICDCAACTKVAQEHGNSGLLLQFVNAVADAIRDQHPDKFLLTLAYNPTFEPPRTDLRARDNVIIYLCKMVSSYCYSPDMFGPDGPGHMRIFAQWAEHAKHIWAWDYALMSHQRGQYFMPLTWMQDAQLKTAKRLGVLDGVFQENEIGRFEDSLFNQFYEMNQWLFMKESCDPDRDLDMLIADYLAGVYGAAAPILGRYVALLRERLPGYPYRMVDWEFMRKAQGQFDRAEAAAAGDAELLDRVRALRLGLDLAALLYRQHIIHSYLQSGGKLEQYPFTIPVLKARILRTLDSTKHPYLTAIKLSRSGENDRKGFIPVQEIARYYVEELTAGKEYAPLPEFAAKLPGEQIIDLTAPLLTPRWGPLLTPDPQAALGLAVTRMNDKELPFGMGTWTHSSREHAAEVIRKGDVTGPGYHWYKGPRHPMRGPDSYIYLTSSWQIQIHPWPEPPQPEQWDVWASIKFTGPAYPHGKEGEPNGMWLDRVILIKARP